MPLAEDPAVALIQIQNEDSLLFWTVNGIGAEQKRRLGKRFADWLAKRHGSLAKAMQRWDGDRLPDDDPKAGIVGFHNVWEMTQDRSDGRAVRLADQLEFWCATMREFDTETERFLRDELGCRQLVNAGNWKTASDARLNDAERWTYTANDVQGVNRYVTGLHTGENSGWAIVDGDRFTDPSVLREPWRLPIAVRQPRGMPFVVSEGGWVPPMSFAAEGPFLIAAYQSLTGVDAYCWFAAKSDDWSPPRSANGFLPSLTKWTFEAPDVLGTFPAAALVWRRAYVARGEPVVVEHRPLADLWNRVSPAVVERSGFDPNRDVVRADGQPTGDERISPLAFLAGPVEVVFGGDAARVDDARLDHLIQDGVVKSVTGQIALDWHRGICTVDAPAAQGVAGFLADAGEIGLTNAAIEVHNTYATVWVVALDGRPLASAGRILVQVGTRCRPTGWRAEPARVESEKHLVDGFRIDAIGAAPWQAERPDVRVTLTGTTVTHGTVLDANGDARGPADVTIKDGTLVLTFPDDALYVVLER